MRYPSGQSVWNPVRYKSVMRFRKQDGTIGIVAAVQVVAQLLRMYNLTVADAHTYVVGDGQYAVIASC